MTFKRLWNSEVRTWDFRANTRDSLVFWKIMTWSKLWLFTGYKLTIKSFERSEATRHNVPVDGKSLKWAWKWVSFNRFIPKTEHIETTRFDRMPVGLTYCDKWDLCICSASARCARLSEMINLGIPRGCVWLPVLNVCGYFIYIIRSLWGCVCTWKVTFQREESPAIKSNSEAFLSASLHHAQPSSCFCFYCRPWGQPTRTAHSRTRLQVKLALFSPSLARRNTFRLPAAPGLFVSRSSCSSHAINLFWMLLWA